MKNKSSNSDLIYDLKPEAFEKLVVQLLHDEGYMTSDAYDLPKWLDLTAVKENKVYGVIIKHRRAFSLQDVNRLVVANDIAVDQVAALEAYYQQNHLAYPKAHTILFTNHDCLDLPYRENAFAVSVCRNLLHHMHTAKDLEALLSNLKRVARRTLIVEIEDPSNGAWWERLRHKYYLDWLKDEGRHFYARPDFEAIIRQHFDGDRMEFDYWPTIRGTYMVANIFKK